MANLRTVLSGLGLGFEHVVMARIYLTRFAGRLRGDERGLSRLFRRGRLPARTCVGVTGLAYDALIEIDLVARRPGY